MRRSRGQVNLEILRLLATENRKATLLAGVTGLNYRQAGLILANLRKRDVVAHVVTGEWKITRRQGRPWSRKRKPIGGGTERHNEWV